MDASTKDLAAAQMRGNHHGRASDSAASALAMPEPQAHEARCSVAAGSAARDKWVADCIAYMVGLGIDADMARSEAEAWIEDNPEDVSECPKAIADDIMSYWVD
jgi:hypothetical protein